MQFRQDMLHLANNTLIFKISTGFAPFSATVEAAAFMKELQEKIRQGRHGFIEI